MLSGKKYGSNVEVIAEIEMHFEGFDKSFYAGIEMLEQYRNDCVTEDEKYFDE